MHWDTVDSAVEKNVVVPKESVALTARLCTENILPLTGCWIVSVDIFEKSLKHLFCSVHVALHVHHVPGCLF